MPPYQMMGELYPGWFVFVFPTTQLLAYLQREMTVLSIGWIPRSGIAGSRSVNIFNCNKSCQITSQKDVAIHSCRQCVNACLPTFQPIANTGCCQSYIFANLSVLGVIECGDIVVLICLILIYSEFFFF